MKMMMMMISNTHIHLYKYYYILQTKIMYTHAKRDKKISLSQLDHQLASKKNIQSSIAISHMLQIDIINFYRQMTVKKVREKKINLNSYKKTVNDHDN